MEKTLLDANVVVVANGFNVPLFSQLWLAGKGIFTEDELTKSSPCFTPTFVQVDTPDCTLTVQSNRMQLKIKKQGSGVIAKIQRIIELLPECPYTGIGFNFSWGVTSFSKDISAVSKKNFLPSAANNPWHAEFKKDHSVTVGAIYRKCFQDSIMHLEIRPQTISIGVGEEHADKDSMIFSFNFHHGINHTLSNDEFNQIFNSWEEKYNESERISDLLVE